MRLAVDTGGTFTDLVVADANGLATSFKSPTSPDDPASGVLVVLSQAAQEMGITLEELLGQADLFIHGTTRGINAVLTGTTAKTAFLTTEGHPDILVFREGGRTEPFNHGRFYPEPYIPRSLTFEVRERIGAQGEIVLPLDEQMVVDILDRVASEDIEAIAVCFLWSIINPSHELRVGELIEKQLPDVAYTLSHALSPAIREYRRASAAAIDASLKPLMSNYFRDLEVRLRAVGFGGRVLVVTSAGGVLDAVDVAKAPIHSIGSGPAMAPVAGRDYAWRDAGADTAIVADSGGTSYDVSLVRGGRIPTTRETWLGKPFLGHMTGFPSVDVKSIGAGGGSIAWVDEGGLLHVGPQSAGAVPGPVCYGRGGSAPTVTDAALVLGYLDPAHFLGGAIQLDVTGATGALTTEIAKKLDLPVRDAAAAVLRLATEHMVRAIEEITLNQGIDPRSAVLVAGGGAGGLNATAIARRLGCERIVIPNLAPTMSAAGALMSDLLADYAAVLPTTSQEFAFEAVNGLLASLGQKCETFARRGETDSLESTTEFSAEVRYPRQVWDLDVPLRSNHFQTEGDVECLRQDFCALHHEVFAVHDPDSPIEVLVWHARVRTRLREQDCLRCQAPILTGSTSSREAYFPEAGVVATRVVPFESMTPRSILVGPAIIQSPFNTVVLEPHASAERTETGSLIIRLSLTPEAARGSEQFQGAVSSG